MCIHDFHNICFDVRAICFESTSRTCFSLSLRWKTFRKENTQTHAHNVRCNGNQRRIHDSCAVYVGKKKFRLFGRYMRAGAQSEHSTKKMTTTATFIDNPSVDERAGWMSEKAWDSMRMYDYNTSKWWKLRFTVAFHCFVVDVAVAVFSVSSESTRSQHTCIQQSSGRIKNIYTHAFTSKFRCVNKRAAWRRT